MQYKKWPCKIDEEHAKQGLSRFKEFKYNVGDCLFDSLVFLLDFTKTSSQLQNGTIDYFCECLKKQYPEALYAYSHELHPLTIKELHNVNDVNTYWRRMRLLAEETNTRNEKGLWGDIFCIH